MTQPADLSAAINHALSLANVEFADNPSPRCPCVLVLDTSGSMDGSPIHALNLALRSFKNDLMQDSLASQRVEVAVVEFNSSVAIRTQFCTVDKFDPPTLGAYGTTALGTAVKTALKLVQDRKSEYRANGVPYYRPWIFLLTDGEPQGEAPEVFADACTMVRKAEKNGEVVFFAVGLGGANMNTLAELGRRPPQRVDTLKFGEMFVWLSKSMQRVSQSKAGEQVALAPVTWGSVAV